MGRWIEEQMGGMFPYFRVEPNTALLAFVIAIFLAAPIAILAALGLPNPYQRKSR